MILMMIKYQICKKSDRATKNYKFFITFQSIYLVDFFRPEKTLTLIVYVYDPFLASAYVICFDLVLVEKGDLSSFIDSLILL